MLCFRVVGTLLPGLAVSAIACGESVAPEPEYDFGRVTARFGSATLWESSYFPDSVVAAYDPGTGHLQIQGQQVRAAGQWPTLQVLVGRQAQVGGFALTASTALQANYAAWFPWTGGSDMFFLSEGIGSDSVWLEEFDPDVRVIQGRFHFRAREANGSAAVDVEGRFRGHVSVLPPLQPY
ncbi:MAG: hypothetical protein ACREOC_16305 [Gemmatimonadales bacterium]